MLEFKRLCAGYGKSKPVLRNISFVAHSGEITVLLGQNGCGKSTLLRAAMGQLSHSGEILLNGTSLLDRKPSQRAREISLLPQHLPAPLLSVRETAALGFAPHATHLGDAEWKTVDDRLAELELTALAERPVNTLSGGERQKVFLAMQLVQNADVLLLDEPATYTDAPFAARLYALLRAACAKGKTVLLVMHDVGEALTIADRIAVLQNGSLAFCGTPAKALETCIPERFFGLTRYTATQNGKPAYFFRAE